MPRILCAIAVASTAALTASITAGPAAAQATIGEIANQGRPIETAPAAAAPGLRSNRPLPTLGEIAQGGAAPQPRAGCTPPPLPGDLPEGAQATAEEMQKTHAAFRSFVDRGQAFIQCLDAAYKANADKITVGGYLALTDAHNRMVAVMQVLADRFNTELRAYKAKGGN